MSTPQAIATVTNTLINLLGAAATGGGTVTSLPPDKAAKKAARAINLFLYQATPSPTWRNMDLPLQNRPGESSSPPLALNLYYLLTPFVVDADDETQTQAMLGQAMGILHDHAVLGRGEIQSASPDSGLHLQVERIRLTLQPLTLDDIFKLWSGYQTPYRLSVAYEASVVLIDSQRAARAPLPVLSRQANPPGTVATATPATESLEPRASMPALPLIENLDPPLGVGPGGLLTISGQNLGGPSAQVRFTSTQAADPTLGPWQSAPTPPPLLVNPSPGPQPGQITVNAPDDPNAWPAGLHKLAVVATVAAGGTYASNDAALSLGPRITLGPTGGGPSVRDPDGTLVLTPAGTLVNLLVTFRPNLRFYQKASLLLGDQEIQAPARASGSAPVDQLSFAIPRASFEAGRRYLVRLRVDGADSPVLDDTSATPRFSTANALRVS